MVNWKKLAKDVGSKTKDASVSVGKSAGFGLTQEEKEERHEKQLSNLKMKSEMEEAKLSRQATKNEYRAKIATAKSEFAKNRPPSGFDKFKKALDNIKATADADKKRQALKPKAKLTKTKTKKEPGMNFEDMLGMGGSGGSNKMNFDDMIGGINKKSKKKGKKKKQKSWDDMVGGGF